MINEPNFLTARRKLKNHCNELVLLERAVSTDKTYCTSMNSSGVKRKRGDKRAKSKRQRTESLNKKCKRGKASPEDDVSCNYDVPENENLPPNKVSTGTSVEVDLLGPCEPGSDIVLEGIVWTETSRGVLVINVTWRGRTYVGTLIDSTTSPRDLLCYRRDHRSSLKGDLQLSAVGERILRSGKRRNAVSLVNEHLSSDSMLASFDSANTSIEESGKKNSCDNVKTESVEAEVKEETLSVSVQNKYIKVSEIKENESECDSVCKTNLDYNHLSCEPEYTKSEIELCKSNSPIKKLESMTSTKLNELKSHNLLQKKSFEIVPYANEPQIMNGGYFNVSSSFSDYSKSSPIDMLTHVVEESTVASNSNYKVKTPKEKCKSLSRCEKKKEDRQFKKVVEFPKANDAKSVRENSLASSSIQRSRNFPRGDYCQRTKTPDVNDWTMQIQTLNQNYVPADENESSNGLVDKKEHNSNSFSKESKNVPMKIQGTKLCDNMDSKPFRLLDMQSRKNSKSVDTKEYFKKSTVKSADSKDSPSIRGDASDSFRWRFPGPMPVANGPHSDDIFSADPHYNHTRNFSTHRAQLQHPYDFTFNPFIIYPNIPRLPLNPFFDPLVKNFYQNYGCLPNTTRPSHL